MLAAIDDHRLNDNGTHYRLSIWTMQRHSHPFTTSHAKPKFEGLGLKLGLVQKSYSLFLLTSLLPLALLQNVCEFRALKPHVRLELMVDTLRERNRSLHLQ